MSLSPGEMMGLVGKLAINAGKAYSDDNNIGRDEWINLLKDAGMAAWDEYSDDDDFPNVK